MSDFAKMLELKRQFERLASNLEGREIQYKTESGEHLMGTVIWVHSDETATVLLENEDGESWEETHSWETLDKWTKIYH